MDGDTGKLHRLRTVKYKVENERGNFARMRFNHNKSKYREKKKQRLSTEDDDDTNNIRASDLAVSVNIDKSSIIESKEYTKRARRKEVAGKTNIDFKPLKSMLSSFSFGDKETINEITSIESHNVVVFKEHKNRDINVQRSDNDNVTVLYERDVTEDEKEQNISQRKSTIKNRRNKTSQLSLFGFQRCMQRKRQLNYNLNVFYKFLQNDHKRDKCLCCKHYSLDDVNPEKPKKKSSFVKSQSDNPAAPNLLKVTERTTVSNIYLLKPKEAKKSESIKDTEIPCSCIEIETRKSILKKGDGHDNVNMQTLKTKSKEKNVATVDHTKTKSFSGGPTAVNACEPTTIWKKHVEAEPKVCDACKQSTTADLLVLFCAISKYLLFITIVIIWLPCILVLGLVWLITYPFRPHQEENNKKNNEDQKPSKKIKQIKCAYCKNKKKCYAYFKKNKATSSKNNKMKMKGTDSQKKSSKRTQYTTSTSTKLRLPDSATNLAVLPCEGAPSSYTGKKRHKSVTFKQSSKNRGTETFSNASKSKHTCSGCWKKESTTKKPIDKNLSKKQAKQNDKTKTEKQKPKLSNRCREILIESCQGKKNRDGKVQIYGPKSLTKVVQTAIRGACSIEFAKNSKFPKNKSLNNIGTTCPEKRKVSNRWCSTSTRTKHMAVSTTSVIQCVPSPCPGGCVYTQAVNLQAAKGDKCEKNRTTVMKFFPPPHCKTNTVGSGINVRVFNTSKSTSAPVSSCCDSTICDKKSFKLVSVHKLFPPLRPSLRTVSSNTIKLKTSSLSKSKEKKQKDDVGQREKKAKKVEKQKDKDIKKSGKEKDKDVKKREKDDKKDTKVRGKEEDKKGKKREKEEKKDTKIRDKEEDKNIKKREKASTKDIKKRDREEVKNVKKREKDEKKDTKKRDKEEDKNAKKREKEAKKETKKRDGEEEKNVKKREKEEKKDTKKRDKEEDKSVKKREKQEKKDVKKREKEEKKDNKKRDKEEDRSVKKLEKEEKKKLKKSEKESEKNVKKPEKEKVKNANKPDKEKEKSVKKPEKEEKKNKNVDKEKGNPGKKSEKEEKKANNPGKEKGNTGKKTEKAEKKANNPGKDKENQSKKTEKAEKKVSNTGKGDEKNVKKYDKPFYVKKYMLAPAPASRHMFSNTEIETSTQSLNTESPKSNIVVKYIPAPHERAVTSGVNTSYIKFPSTGKVKSKSSSACFTAATKIIKFLPKPRSQSVGSITTDVKLPLKPLKKQKPAKKISEKDKVCKPPGLVIQDRKSFARRRSQEMMAKKPVHIYKFFPSPIRCTRSISIGARLQEEVKIPRKSTKSTTFPHKPLFRSLTATMATNTCSVGPTRIFKYIKSKKSFMTRGTTPLKFKEEKVPKSDTSEKKGVDKTGKKGVDKTGKKGKKPVKPKRKKKKKKPSKVNFFVRSKSIGKRSTGSNTKRIYTKSREVMLKPTGPLIRFLLPKKPLTSTRGVNPRREKFCFMRELRGFSKKQICKYRKTSVIIPKRIVIYKRPDQVPGSSPPSRSGRSPTTGSTSSKSGGKAQAKGGKARSKQRADSAKRRSLERAKEKKREKEKDRAAALAIQEEKARAKERAKRREEERAEEIAQQKADFRAQDLRAQQEMDRLRRKNRQKARKRKPKLTFKQNFRLMLEQLNPENYRMECQDLISRKPKPCKLIYDLWPSAYPAFMVLYKMYNNVMRLFFFFLACCVWSPLFCWCFVFYFFIIKKLIC